MTRWIQLSGATLTYVGLLDLKERVPENATKMVELADRFLEARKGHKWRYGRDKGVRPGGSDVDQEEVTERCAWEEDEAVLTTVVVIQR